MGVSVKLGVLNILFLFCCFGCNQAAAPAKPVTSSSSNASSSNALDLVCSQLAASAAKNTTFSLFNNPTNLFLSSKDPLSEFEQAADIFVEEKLDQHIVATPVGLGFQIRGDVELRDYQLSIAGVPLCSNELTVYLRPNTHELWMTGRIPDIEGLDSSVFNSIPTLIYPTEDFAVSSIYKTLKLEGQISSSKTLKQCIIFENEHFTPAIKVSFTVRNRPYIGLATATNDFALFGVDSNIRSAAPAFLEEATTTEGTANVAVSGVAISTSGSSTNVYQTKSVKLTGISTGGSLCSQNFVVLSLTGNPRSPTVNAPPFSSTQDFSYAEDDNKFYATTAFYNASSHVSWLLDNGIIPNWPGPQIQIVLNETNSNNDGANNGVNNTAVFLPNGNTLEDPPQIELGNGDGKLLQKLWSEPGAIQHETGHHLIYTRLTDIGNKISVVIHEALADAQVLLQNQSPCLCPTVCTTSSSVCFSQKCLRSAANNFTMAATSCTSDGLLSPPQCLPTEVHQRSQVISGMLWDIAQTIGPGNDGYRITLKLVIRAITYLSASSEYSSLLEALIKADEDLGGKYRTIILNEMCARGFDNAKDDSGKSWMSALSVPYTCSANSGAIPKAIGAAPASSGAFSVPTTATGGS